MFCFLSLLLVLFQTSPSLSPSLSLISSKRDRFRSFFFLVFFDVSSRTRKKRGEDERTKSMSFRRRKRERERRTGEERGEREDGCWFSVDVRRNRAGIVVTYSREHIRDDGEVGLDATCIDRKTTFSVARVEYGTYPEARREPISGSRSIFDEIVPESS